MLAGSQLEVTPLRCVSIKGRGRAAESVDLTSPSQRPGSDGTDLFALLMASALSALERAAAPRDRRRPFLISI